MAMSNDQEKQLTDQISAREERTPTESFRIEEHMEVPP